MSDTPTTGPDWLIQLFAEHLPVHTTRIIENMVQASIAGEIDGGVLTERYYSVDAITDAVVRVRPRGGLGEPIIVPETEVRIIPSIDVPTGRVHHVMHFQDGDHTLFSRMWQQDHNTAVSS